MFARRAERPSVDASASTATGLSSISADPLYAMQERLNRLSDEESWNTLQAKEIFAHNAKSITFYLLGLASLCFAALNGYHGWTSSGAVSAGGVAIVIGILYFVIELTVPVSAHMISWKAGGGSCWGVRTVGLFGYLLGVCFSLLILQGKFSSGADSASAQADAKAAVYAADRSSLDNVQKKIAALTPKVDGQSPESLLAQMKSIMATQVSKGSTLADATEECQGTKRTAQQKDLCAKYDALRTKREDATELRAAEEKLAKLTTTLSDGSRTSVRNADVQDKVIARISGVSVDNIQMFKSSAIAVMAALLTHLLWAGHGSMVNAKIARRREAVLERKALDRASAYTVAQREAVEAERKAALLQTAEQTTANFLAARGSNAKVAESVANAPLREQPVVIQVQKYFVDRAHMDESFSVALGIFHDDYNVWCQKNKITPVPLDRFKQLVKDIGLHISADARIVGAALK